MPISKPKVLIVIARLNVGGTAQYIYEVTKGLLAQGYEVLVATGNVQGSERESEVVSELPIRRIVSLGRKISPVNDLKTRSELRKLIAEFKPDLVYSHTFKAGLLVRTIYIEVPRIHAFHGHLLDEPELRGWKVGLVVAIERYLAPRAKYLVTVGKKVADELLERKIGEKSQYRSIAPGVHPLKLNTRSDAMKRLGLTGDRLRVGWLARVTAVKAPLKVIEIAESFQSVEFIMAGGGDLLDEVRAKAPANLKVLGWQSASDIWAVCDIAISTSENEGMPVALIEAQLAGIPVVARDVGSVREVIEDGETGFIHAQVDEGYMKSLRTLIEDEKLLKKISDAARKRSLREFGVDRLISSHVDLIKDTLSS